VASHRLGSTHFLGKEKAMPTSQRVIEYGTRARPDSAKIELESFMDSAESRIREALEQTSGNALEDSDWDEPETPEPKKQPIPIDRGESKQVRILIADDHPVVREGLVAVIDRCCDMQVVGEASDGREAMKKYFESRPDVALLDLRMPLMDGIETVVAIFAKDPACRLMVLTSYQSAEDVYRALRSGARGYLLKDSPVGELYAGIRAVAEGRTWVPAGVGAVLAKRITDRELTKREMDVLRTVVAGKSNKEIGVAFNISEATVKVHVTHILEKLKVTGRTEAANIAVRRGLVCIDSPNAA
jgi:two-component system NarL family response regulator